jgi:AcrR family transcriptional regulator
MLYVRITVQTNSSVVEDLTARARIRDAAIACFAANGFDATVRQIAALAGVSAGLITHHFGSKDALRDACDTEVLRKILELNEDGIRRPPSQAIARIAELDDFGAMFGYLLRSVREGGEAGRGFLRNLIEDAKVYTAEAVENGIVRPSGDPDARAELLVTQSIGGMLLQLTLQGETDFSDAGALIRRFSEETTFATLELYTQGLLTDSSLLDEYVKQVPAAAPKQQRATHD